MGASDSDVPPRVIADAKAAVATRAPDSALLCLLEDSLDRDGPISPRRLRFAGAGVTMSVVVTGEVGYAVLRVQTSGLGEVFTVERADGGRELATGERVVDTGIIRIHLPAGPKRSALHTDWFRV